jgi:hypothetical protein
MTVVAMPRRMDVQQAREDLHRRTLSDVARPLDRLIYLASMRDYNTGVYHHDGLASRYTEEVACEALADSHREVFHQLVLSPLGDLVDQLEAYRKSTHTGAREFLTAWRRLEPYRVAVPVETDQLAAEFLFSNFKIALAILEARLDSLPVELSA